MFVHADIGTQCYVDGWGGVGWDDNVHVTRDAQRTAMQNLKLVDNSTESEISRVKGQMRRTNMLGRISPRNAQVQQFAAKRLLEKPGLMPLVTAFAEYRRDRKNQMGIQPGHAVTRFKLRKTTLGSHEKKEWTRLPKPTPRNPHIRGKKCTDTRCAYGKSA